MISVKVDDGGEFQLDNGHDYGVVISCVSSDDASAEDSKGEATISMTAAQAFQLAYALLESVRNELSSCPKGVLKPCVECGKGYHNTCDGRNWCGCSCRRR